MNQHISPDVSSTLNGLTSHPEIILTATAENQVEEAELTSVMLGNYNCSAFNICSTMETDEGVNLNAALHMQIIYLIIGLVGMSGNALVAGVLLHFKSMRKSMTNTFIINQSLIDGTASFFILLATFLRDVDSISDPIAQEIICRLWLTNLPIWGIFLSSTYNMVAVTFERYSALVHPLSHQRHFTRKRAFIVIAAVWMFGPAYNAAYMIPTAGMVDGECTVYSIWPSTEIQTAVGIFTVVIQYFIPLGLITYAYTRIAIVLTRAGAGKKKPKDNVAGIENHDNNVSNVREQRMSRARKNVIKTLAMVSLCFVFCWSWNQIYYTMYNCGFDADFNSTFYHFTVIMVFCNCCMNPIVYAVKYEQFQKGVMMIFCKRANESSENNSTGTSSIATGEKIDPDVTQQIQRNIRLLQRLSSDPMIEKAKIPIDEIQIKYALEDKCKETKICIISGNTVYHTKL